MQSIHLNSEEDNGLGDIQIHEPEATTSSDQGKRQNNSTTSQEDERFNTNWKHKSSHPKDLIIGNLDEGIITRSKIRGLSGNFALVSELEPKSVEEALIDESWINAMQKEL